MTIRFGLAACGLSLAIGMQFAAADNYNVTNTSDSAPGSLRQAILDANAHANANANTPDTISFAIPGSGLQTIIPLTALPAITDPVVIDGFTQTGSSANTMAVGNNSVHLIELNGNGANFAGLTISAGNSTVRGLVINRFNGNGPANAINLLTNGGRNSLVGPGLVSFDMSLFKNNPIKRISESFNVQFRAEAFNIINRSNFSPPTDNNTLFDGSGNPVGGAGLIDGTSTTSRQIQLALKLIF